MRRGKRAAIAIAFIMAIVMALDMPGKQLAGSMQLSKTAKAAESTKYVSDVRLACAGSSGDAEDTLTKDGYKKVEGDLNATTGKDYVYMGYKTTTDPKLGITDIKAIKQENGYTIFDSKMLMGQFTDEGAEDAIYLLRMVKEFQKNYADGQFFAKSVYDVFQHYKMTDTKKLGDYLLNPDITDTDLTEIVLYADTQMSVGLYQFLRVALIKDDKETCFTKIQEVKDEDVEATTKVKSKARILLTSIKSFQTYMDYAVNDAVDKAEALGKKEITEEEASMDSEFLMAADYLRQMKYMEQDLLTFFSNKDLKVTDLYAMADCFSDAEIQALKFLGMPSFVSLSQWSEAKFEETDDKIDNEDYDFWEGSTKEENSRIALTNDMMQQMIVGNTESVSQAILNGKNIGVITGTGLCLLATGVTAAVYFTKVSNLTKSAMEVIAAATKAGVLPEEAIVSVWLMQQAASGMKGVPQNLVTAVKSLSTNARTALQTMESSTLVSAKAATSAVRAATAGVRSVLSASVILTIVAILITAVFLIIDFVDYYTPKYSEFPNTILSLETLEDGSNAYVTYHAVMDGDKVGDANARQGRKWNALYYTTSETMGTPIRAGSLKCYTGTQESNEDSTPVTLFGDSKVFNLNTNTYSNDRGTYLYYSRVDSNTLASIFSNPSIMILALLVLVLLAGATGIVIIRRRKKKKVC